MSNYVLVHGAWGGNQSYDLTRRDLEAAGHRVIACTLRGLGSRAFRKALSRLAYAGSVTRLVRQPVA